MTHSLEAEKALLGLMLERPEHVDAAGQLDVADLFLDSHRRIFSLVRQMHAEGQIADLTSVTVELQRRKMVGTIGGVAYLADLAIDLRAAQGPESFVRTIRECATRRKIQALCQVAAARAEAGEDPAEILYSLQAVALETQATSERTRAHHVREFIVPTWESIKEEIARPSGETLGIPTGIAGQDEVMGGWRPGELTYVGALPSRGKTALLLQCMNAALVYGYGVGCISLEMRAQQLLRRLATMRSGLHAYKFRDPRKMSLADQKEAQRALYALADEPVWINDQSGLKPSAIAMLARQMVAEGAKLVMVDFVQIVVGDGDDQREAINKVSAVLRDTAKGLGVPFVVASQLARRTGDMEKVPTMRDLRESGNLEQDAHNVVLIHRPKRNGEWVESEAELIVEKQREGATGPVPVTYDERSLTFVDRRPMAARSVA